MLSFLSVHKGWRFSIILHTNVKRQTTLTQTRLSDGLTFSRDIGKPHYYGLSDSRRWYAFGEEYLYVVTTYREVYKLSIDENKPAECIFKDDRDRCLFNSSFVLLAKDRLIIAANHDKTYCIDLEGRLLWKKERSCKMDYGIILKDILYTATYLHNTVYKYSLDGEEIGKIESQYGGWGLATDGTFLYCLGSMGATVIPHDMYLGETVAYTFPMDGSPALKVLGVHKSGVYALVRDHMLVEISYKGVQIMATSGKYMFRYYHATQIVDGIVYCDGCEFCKDSGKIHTAPVKWEEANLYISDIQNHIDNAAEVSTGSTIKGSDVHVILLEKPGNPKKIRVDVKETFGNKPFKHRMKNLSSMAEKKIAVAMAHVIRPSKAKK